CPPLGKTTNASIAASATRPTPDTPNVALRLMLSPLLALSQVAEANWSARRVIQCRGLKPSHRRLTTSTTGLPSARRGAARWGAGHGRPRPRAAVRTGGERRPGQSDELPLARGQPNATRAHVGVQAFRQRREPVVGTDPAQRSRDVLVARLRPAEPHVVCDRPREEVAFLRQEDDVPSQG